MADTEEPQAEASEIPPLEEPTQAEDNGVPPSLLWISEGVDTVISPVYVYQDGTTGRLKTILWEPAPELINAGMKEYPVEMTWSVPSKLQLNDYRERCSRFNPAAKAVLLRKQDMEEMVIQNHLIGLKLGPEGHQTVIELKKDKKGALTRESLAQVNKLHPSVMDMAFAKFIDEAALLL